LEHKAMAKEITRTNFNRPRTATAVTPQRVTKTVTKTLLSEDQIRARAYEIYRARNGGPGDPASDWAQAERELQAQSKR
jgi:hypothetical protein